MVNYAYKNLYKRTYIILTISRKHWLELFSLQLLIAKTRLLVQILPRARRVSSHTRRAMDSGSLRNLFAFGILLRFICHGNWCEPSRQSENGYISSIFPSSFETHSPSFDVHEFYWFTIRFRMRALAIFLILSYSCLW